MILSRQALQGHNILRHLGTLMAAMSMTIALGCATTDFNQIRTEHAEEFPAEFAQKTQDIININEPLDLDACITIALENNLDIKVAEIKGNLATIDRKIAFSYFLPYVDVQVTRVNNDEQQLMKFGSSAFAMADQNITQAVISAQLAVFNPQTWFLYSAYKKGEDIQALVTERVRQAISLQVTALYMACLSQETSGKALTASVEQAQALVKQMEAFHREGLILNSDLDEAKVYLILQENNLADNQRLQKSTKAELMEAMGLSPLADITLKGAPSFEVADDELTDQIYIALINRPEMKAYDRNIAVKEDAVKIAIAGFFPVVGLFTEYTYNSNSYYYYENIWSYGVSGVLTVFDGFANIQEYKKAKQEREEAMVEREQQCLKIMLEVIKARDLMEKAQDMKTLLSKQAEVSAEFLKEIQAQWDEGLITSSDRLKAVSNNATAEANLALANYQYQVATASMIDAMGLSGKE